MRNRNRLAALLLVAGCAGAGAPNPGAVPSEPSSAGTMDATHAMHTTAPAADAMAPAADAARPCMRQGQANGAGRPCMSGQADSTGHRMGPPDGAGQGMHGGRAMQGGHRMQGGQGMHGGQGMQGRADGGCAMMGSTATSAAPDPESIERGREIFAGRGNCHTCHGATATGTALAPNLTDETWLHGVGNPMQIQHIIMHGIPRPLEHPGPMPAKGGAELSRDDVQDLVSYVRSLRG